MGDTLYFPFDYSAIFATCENFIDITPICKADNHWPLNLVLHGGGLHDQRIGAVREDSYLDPHQYILLTTPNTFDNLYDSLAT